MINHGRIQFVKSQLHRWIDEMMGMPQDQDVMLSFGKALALRNYILANPLTPDELTVYMGDTEVQDYMHRYREFSNHNEVQSERLMSTILRSNGESDALIRSVKDYYAEVYKLLARAELHISKATKKSKIVMIGSGGMPLSTLFMHRFSGAQVTGLDIDEESLEAGIQYIDFLTEAMPGKFDREMIDMRLADGASFDYGDSDIVILSIHIEDKEAVVKRIVETANRSADVVIVDRRVRGLGEYFYRNHSFNAAALSLVGTETLCSSLLHSTAYRLSPQ